MEVVGKTASEGARLLRLSVASGLVLAVSIGAAFAGDIFSSKSHKSAYGAQLDVLDGRAAQQYSNSYVLRPYAAQDGFAGRPFSGQYNGPYLAVARDMALRHGVPADLFLRLVQQESGWNPKARSHKGALGLAQLMPQTARLLGVNPLDPVQNLEGGARYLRAQFNTFGSWRLALAAYNAGPAAVQKYGGVPPFDETQTYVKIILGS